MNRDQFIQLLGQQPLRPLPNPKTIEEVDCVDFVRKKLTFTVEDNEKINAYLCIPKKTRPLPAIYCFHQHAGNHLLGKSEVVGLSGSSDQAYAKELAQRGFITLAPDAICFEERSNSSDPYRYHAEQLSARLMLGRTLLGKILSDISAGIDLLEGMDIVDKNRIGFIGHSYGGRTALFAPVYDKRIKASVSSCGSTRFRDMINNNIGIQFDFVVPDFLSYGDIEDIVCLHDSSSLLILGKDDDKWSLSIPEINKKIRDYPKNRIKTQIFSGKHEFSDEMRLMAYKFLEDNLKQ